MCLHEHRLHVRLVSYSRAIGFFRFFSRIVQFYIKFGCTEKRLFARSYAEPVLLQFSTDGGIHWTTMERLEYNDVDVDYVVLHIPIAAKTNATRIQWWQPTMNGSFVGDWALDQVSIQARIFVSQLIKHNSRSTFL